MMRSKSRARSKSRSSGSRSRSKSRQQEGKGGNCQTPPLSTSSEEEQSKRITRLSSRKTEVDFAYDADADSTSDSSSKEKHDPYTFDCIEDGSTMSKDKKQSIKTRPRKQTKKKGSLKTQSNTTSTPVLVGTTSNNSHVKESEKTKLLLTPEVTPILPVRPDEKKENLADSYDTPTVRRSHRKRSLCLDNGRVSPITSVRSLNSLGDSGIGISPPLKRGRLSESYHLNSSNDNDYGSVSEDKKQDSHSVIKKYPHKSYECSDLKQKKRKIFVQKTENVTKKCKRNSSCFGFDISLSPVEENIPRMKKRKCAKSTKQPYRTQTVSISSLDSPDLETSKFTNRENCQRLTQSPTLFSDDLFSDDAASDMPKVNKTSNKSYTSVKLKGKTQKQIQKISKLESWADEINSQIADIEKFQLVIE